jgi:cytochrome b561
MTTRDTLTIYGAVSRFVHWTGALFALHLLGVIKHQFIDRVNILGRMTGRGQDC